MKVEPRGGMKNKSNTAGFVNVEGFEGATMRISAGLLKQAIESVENINEELDDEYINIGIAHNPENPVGTEMFFIFLDAKRLLAYAVMGATEE